MVTTSSLVPHVTQDDLMNVDGVGPSKEDECSDTRSSHMDLERGNVVQNMNVLSLTEEQTDAGLTRSQ